MALPSARRDLSPPQKLRALLLGAGILAAVAGGILMSTAHARLVPRALIECSRRYHAAQTPADTQLIDQSYPVHGGLHRRNAAGTCWELRSSPTFDIDAGRARQRLGSDTVFP